MLLLQKSRKASTLKKSIKRNELCLIMRRTMTMDGRYAHLFFVGIGRFMGSCPLHNILSIVQGAYVSLEYQALLTRPVHHL